MTVLWIATIALAVLLIGLVALMFLLLAMGRMHLDLGWGRSTHPLGPLEVRIAAPRALVFELMAAPYLGRAPAGGIDVVARGDDIVVAAHYTRVHFYTARTVEVVDFAPPSRVGFRHLTGPVPHALEEFALSESNGSTDLRYKGEIGIDFFLLGRIAGRRWVRPQWERAVGAHLEELKRRAEERAARRSARAKRQAGAEEGSP